MPDFTVRGKPYMWMDEETITIYGETEEAVTAQVNDMWSQGEVVSIALADSND